jgi:hypothetical protein
MDVRSAVVPTAQLVLAACLGILAVLGMIDTDPAVAGALVVLGASIAWLVVLPMTGIAALGLFDWQAGRGPGILRAGNVVIFLLAAAELREGTPGFARWLTGTIALAAAIGLAGSIVTPPPRRAGFRR